MKIFKSKKGIGVDDLFPLVFALIVIVVVVSFFILAPKVTQDKNDKLAEKDILPLKSDAIFNYYLQKEIPIDSIGKKISTAELLTLYYIEEDKTKKEEYKGNLDWLTIDFLNNLEYCYKANKITTVFRGFIIAFSKDPPPETTMPFTPGLEYLFQSKAASKKDMDITHMSSISQPLPLPNGDVIYVAWIETARRVSWVGTAGDLDYALRSLYVSCQK